MPISTKCPGCGQTIAAPDSAAGHKAKCPKCGGVIRIPSPDPAAVLAAALSSRSAPGGAAVAEVQVLKEGPGEESRAASEPTPSSRSAAGHTSATTIDRMIARTSPYGSLRLMSAIIFGVGVAMAAILLLGGLSGLIIISTRYGQPLIAVGAFVGAAVAALVLFVGAKTASDLVRLWADVGDRARQMAQMLEESLGRSKDNSV
jgi:ribosomal protein S27E